MNVYPFLRIIVACCLFSCVTTLSAQKEQPFDPLTATIEENIQTPKVSPKKSEAVVAVMKELRKSLAAAKYNTSAVRSGEVIMVTIPCSELFAANDTKLADKAKAVLTPLEPYIQATDLYKVVIAVHTDDTGDETYADRITDQRAEAIDEFFSKANHGKDSGIIPYGLGKDEPLAPNTSLSRRQKNRRVEIYFIPTGQTIQRAKKR